MTSVRTGWQRIALLATVFVVGAMVVAAFFHNEFRSQNWDPMQTRVYVLRTIHFGGTFYENGLVNKGPVEPLVYRLAAAVTPYDGFWYAISAIIIVVSGILAWAAGKTAFVLGGHRLLGVAIGIGVFFHFALGNADYAGALYSRNMIIGLYAGAWLIAITPRWWSSRRAPIAAGAIGVLLGLGIQTLFVSTIAAIGVGLMALATIETVADEQPYRRSRRLLVITPIVVFLSCPIYYVIRGRFTEFWSSYWTYNTYQNAATGRSFANQLVYGRDVILRYYRSWPVSLVIIVAFVGATIALWPTFDRRSRAIHISITVWFIGAWAELVAGQRYSSHYFSILAIPTALMAAAVLGHGYRLMRRERGREFRSIAVWPLAASLLAIAAGGGQHLTLGLEAASSYSSVHQVAEQRRSVEPGQQRTVRAVMDLASVDGDPLLAWTEFPWVYLNYHRTAATRWIWKSFMLGQIYLGRSSPDYVLHETWQWFADDMAEAKPAVLLEEVALPVAAGTPFDAYVNANFRPVFTNADNIVHLRNDVAKAIIDGSGDGEVFTPTGTALESNWNVGRGEATLAPETVPSLTDALELSTSRCTRISGTYTGLAGAAGSFLSFRLDDPRRAGTNARLNIVGDEVVSGNDTTIFDTTYLGDGGPTEDQTVGPTNELPGAEQPTPVPEPHDFAVVVGEHSAALVIDGQIHAAVRLDGQTRLSLEVRQGGVTLTELGRSRAPNTGGC
ncbi:MAG: hypothetical protein ABIR32_06970 [Ilumatobacteraceae bacterium]